MRLKSLLIFFWLIITSNLGAQNLIIEGGWLILPDSTHAVKNTGLQIIAGKIHSIGTASNDKTIPRVNLGDDDYVLPGLFDLHAHLKVVYGDLAKEDTTITPLLYLANGITTIYTCGEVDPDAVLAYKRNVARGTSVGPRVLNSGPYFGDQAPNWREDYTESDIYAIVDEWASKGVDGFKARDISEMHLKALIERAHMHDLTVTGHISHIKFPEVSSDIAIPMGIDRLEHFIGGSALKKEASAYREVADLVLSDSKIDKTIDLFIDHNIYFNSTLSVIGGFTKSEDQWLQYWTDEKKYWSPYAQSIVEGNPERWSPKRQQFYDKSKVLLKRYYDRGGLISMGTDGPLGLDFLWVFKTPGFNTHREMAMMSEIGIPNHEVVKIASLNSAKAMRISDKQGSIAVGKFGDLMIIKGNPLDDIYNTRNVHTVIKHGKVYDTKELLKSCEGKLGPLSEESWFKNKEDNQH
ncbi:amidohydrolase family protein [Flavobacteriaceae bacterium GSB9]|nr:amidohydrolase family protein [Flavobacteriaceae bacterium GSB9]